MIKINKFENIYGIRKLKNGNKLGRINVIYAPNGTAKSSICDALLAISKGEDCNDIYGQLPPSDYEVDVDGVIVSKANRQPFNIICYSGTEKFDITSNHNLTNMAISASVKSGITNHIGIINNELKKVETALQTVFGKKYGTKSFNESMEGIIKEYSSDNILENILSSGPFSSIKPYSLQIDLDLFLNLTSSAAQNAATNEEVKSACGNYFSIVSKTINDDIIKGDFSLDNLQNVLNSAIKENYFDEDKTRLFKINGTDLTREDLEKIIKEKETKIYGTSEARESFNAVKKSLSKKNTAGFRESLENNKSLVPELLDYENMAKRLFVNLIGQNNAALFDLARRNIETERKEIEKILSLTTVDNEIHKLWAEYKSMFTFDRFELEIENKQNAFLGLDVPTFVKYTKKNHQLIQDPKKYRFSTGEIRAYNFINFILEVESRRRDGVPLTVVMDDVAESFDYKNKYAIINYVKTISEHQNIQLIILTHNFDFYRSVTLAIGESGVNQFFAYKDRDDNVELFDSDKNYYLNISNFNAWKNAPSIEKFFALIPFSRTIIQLEKRGQDNDLNVVLSYLHYDLNLETADVSGLVNTLTNRMNINCPTDLALTDKYLKKLSALSSSICSSTIKETDLEYKITIGLYLRIFLERFLVMNYYDHANAYPTISNHFSFTRELIDLSKTNNYLSPDEINMVEEINVICPPYIHVNSFMYEPLVDVSGDDLVRFFNLLNSANQKWPL